MDEEKVFHHREKIFLHDLDFGDKINDMKMYETPYYCLFAGVTVRNDLINFKIIPKKTPNVQIGKNSTLKIRKVDF